jgi:hypothetical protein
VAARAEELAAGAAPLAGDGCGIGRSGRLAAAARDAAELARQRGSHRLERASLDSLSVRAKRGPADGPNPTDGDKLGSKYHLVTDRNGIPLAIRLSAANAPTRRSCSRGLIAIPSIIGPEGNRGGRASVRGSCTATRPTTLQTSAVRCVLAVYPRIAVVGSTSSERLGRHRWVVERTARLATWLPRLGVRYERRAICSKDYSICLRHDLPQSLAPADDP